MKVKIKIKAARAFSVFVGQREPCLNTVVILPTLDFRNFWSLAVGQTNEPCGLLADPQLKIAESHLYSLIQKDVRTARMDGRVDGPPSFPPGGARRIKEL